MKDSTGHWQTISTKEIADCRVFRVREDVAERDGLEGTFYVIENPDWVNVVAITKDEQVVMIEQFRHGIHDLILEIPGGMVDEGEEPAAAAARELLEETGYSSSEWVFLGSSLPNPALQSNAIHHYLAIGCEKTAEPSFDEHESIATKLYPLMAVPEMIKSGQISHSLVVAAFQYFSFHWFKV